MVLSVRHARPPGPVLAARACCVGSRVSRFDTKHALRGGFRGSRSHRVFFVGLGGRRLRRECQSIGFAVHLGPGRGRTTGARRQRGRESTEGGHGVCRCERPNGLLRRASHHRCSHWGTGPITSPRSLRLGLGGFRATRHWGPFRSNLARDRAAFLGCCNTTRGVRRFALLSSHCDWPVIHVRQEPKRTARAG